MSVLPLYKSNSSESANAQNRSVSFKTKQKSLNVSLLPGWISVIRLKQVRIRAMSDCASIYVFYHCVSVCMFVQSGGRQWAFVSQHPIFLSQADTHTHTHSCFHIDISSWLPPSYLGLKTTKQEQSEPLILPHTSCPLPLPQRATKKMNEGEKDGTEWWQRKGEGVRGRDKCRVGLCVNGKSRWRTARMWPEVVAKQSRFSGEQVPTAPAHATGISVHLAATLSVFPILNWTCRNVVSHVEIVWWGEFNQIWMVNLYVVSGKSRI